MSHVPVSDYLQEFDKKNTFANFAEKEGTDSVVFSLNVYVHLLRIYNFYNGGPAFL